MVRRQWGAGDYEVRLYGERDGAFGVLGRSEVEIAAPVEPVASVGGAVPGLERFLESQQAFNQKMLEAITAKPDPMASMRDTLALMVTMREAMGLTNQAPQKSSIAEIMEAGREMRAVAEEINPPKEDAADSSDPMAIVSKIADLVGQAMKNPRAAAQLQTQFPAVALPPGLALPLPTTQASASAEPVASTQPAPIAPTTEEPGMSVEELQSKFSQVIAFAQQWATMTPEQRIVSSVVGDAAEIVYEFLPDEAVEVFRSEQWFDAVVMIEPEAKPHREFLALVRNKALAIFDEESQPSPLSKLTLCAS